MSILKKVIRQGDTLREFGGIVLQGQSLAFGRPIACVGDAAFCQQHYATIIIEGTLTTTIYGKPVALDGHRCACGCSLVSSLAEVDIAL